MERAVSQMTPPEAPFPSDPYQSELITPDQVREVAFPPARLGRRGVDEGQVRAFCGRVADAMTRSLVQRTALAVEVRRLRERMRDSSGPLTGLTPEDAQVQAVNVLTMAQRTADKYVADAQDYSRELSEEARLRHDEIIREAQVRAAMILDQAKARAESAAGAAAALGDGAVPGTGCAGGDGEAAYLRAVSQACRTHLKAYLESLSKSLEEWEQAEAHGVASARASLPAPPS